MKKTLSSLNFGFLKTAEITSLAFFFFLTSTIYMFPNIFIMYIITGCIVIYLVLSIMYHKYSFNYQQRKNKRTQTYISYFEVGIENTYALSEQLYQTLIFLKKSPNGKLNLKNKRANINKLLYTERLLEIANLLEKRLLLRSSNEAKVRKSTATF